MARPDAPTTSEATTPQLQVRIFQCFLDAVDHTRPFPRQASPHPREIAQLANLPWWHETAAQKPVLQQIRDALPVFEIRLFARNRFQMLRVYQQ
jgi:hypothetical protein